MEGGRVSDEDTKDEPYDMCEDAEEAECPSVRFHTIVPGNIKNYIIDFKTRLAACSEVTEVSSTKWSDVTLVFCPIVSRVGTDIEAALRDVEDSKPCILVAMHHTFDPEYVIPNSRRFGRSKNVLIVDCLFHEELGLLKCESNEEAHQVIMNHLKEEQEKKIPAQQLEDTKSLDTSGVASGCEATWSWIQNQMLWSAVTNPGCETRLYTLVPDKVKKECTTLLTKLDAKKPTKATEVSSLEECDVILAFCPIVTRLGTDIEAALKDIPDTKPGILVVMHFTFDPDYVIPNSSRFVQERDIVTVDLLFNKDVGLIECEHNSQAVDKLGKSLKNCEKTSQDPVPSNENTDRGEQTSTEEQHGIETTASTERSVEPEDAKEQQQILSQTFWSAIEYLGSTIINIIWQFWTAEEQPVSTSYSESSEGAAT